MIQFEVRVTVKDRFRIRVVFRVSVLSSLLIQWRKMCGNIF